MMSGNTANSQSYSQGYPQPTKRGPSLMKSQQLISWITVNKNSPLELAGYPGEAPVVYYDSFHICFEEAEYLLASLVDDISSEVEFAQEPCREQFPEINEVL